MGIGALVGGTVLSGVLGARSADKAASAQASAAAQANATERYIFDRSVELTEPQRQAGNNALAVMRGAMGIGGAPVFGYGGKQQFLKQGDDGRWNVESPNGLVWRSFDTWDEGKAFMDENATTFEASPGFQYGVDQAQEAINRNAAARGVRYGGGTLNALAADAQGRQNQEFGNWYNRLAGQAGIGQSATQQQLAAGQGYASGVGQNMLSAGSARASGYMGQANALTGTLNNLGGIYGAAMGGQFGPNPGLGINPSPAGLKMWGYS